MLFRSAGIAPSSAPAYIAAQILGYALAIGIIRALYPVTPADAADIIVPHDAGGGRAAQDGVSPPAGQPSAQARPQ